MKMSDDIKIICPICHNEDIDDYDEKAVVVRMDYYCEKAVGHTTAKLIWCSQCYKFFIVNVDF